MTLISEHFLDQHPAKFGLETQRRTDLIQEICAPRRYCSKLYCRNQGLRYARLCSWSISHCVSQNRVDGLLRRYFADTRSCRYASRADKRCFCSNTTARNCS